MHLIVRFVKDSLRCVDTCRWRVLGKVGKKEIRFHGSAVNVVGIGKAVKRQRHLFTQKVTRQSQTSPTLRRFDGLLRKLSFRCLYRGCVFMLTAPTKATNCSCTQCHFFVCFQPGPIPFRIVASTESTHTPVHDWEDAGQPKHSLIISVPKEIVIIHTNDVRR